MDVLTDVVIKSEANYGGRALLEKSSFNSLGNAIENWIFIILLLMLWTI